MQTQAEREEAKLAEGREKILRTVMQAEAKGKTGQLPYMHLLSNRYLEPLAAEIVQGGVQKRAGSHVKYAAYLGSLDPLLVALRAIQACVELLANEGGLDSPAPVHKKLAYAVGRSVYYEYLMRHFQHASAPLFNTLLREFSRSMSTDEQFLMRQFKQRFKTEGYTQPTWEHGDQEMVGNFLVGRLEALGFLEVWCRTEKQPRGVRVVKYVCLHEDVRSMSLALVEHVADMPRATGPMIEPPLPWDAQTNTGGGFHTLGMQRLCAYAVQGRGQTEVAESTIEALNNLQAVPWRINGDVLSIVQQAALLFDFGDVTSLNPGPKPEYPEDGTDEQKAIWKAHVKAWYADRKVRGVRYLRNRKALDEAEEMRAEAGVWFTYYADFRGRLYARTGGVSPQGGDLEKGLLHFARGKPLDTPEAVRWFKLHGANKYGIDKVSFDARLAWVQEHHEQIIASARSPLDCKFWTEADAPVQFLAWALEYAAWTEDAQFPSRLPISLDGTCNGLQNYSALLRDQVGGTATNLVDGPAPRDIYAAVAERALVILAGLPASPLRDAWLAHGINRKVTKRTSMTLPYGCTRYACAEFIVKDYLEPTAPKEIDKADYGAAGNFLSHVVWAAIGDIVVKARECMEWLKGWAKHCVDTGQAVEWTTPNGLVVRSEYPKEKKLIVKSVAFKSQIYLSRPELGTVDGRRVQNAVAPNFVHSLDSAHLCRVVNEAARRGMTPSAIHDDYGVHAADTEAFTAVIREKFVGMYLNDDILKRMAESKGYKVPPPEPGTLDLQSVLSSTYFFA